MAGKSLKEKTAKGLVWGSIGNGAQLVLGLVFGIVLARLLSPADYGMTGILQIFIFMAGTVTDSGFRTALANRPEVRHEDYNAVFWFNVSTAAVLYLILYLCAPLITAFYQKAGPASGHDLSALTPLARFCFAGIVISSIGTAHYAYLKISEGCNWGCGYCAIPLIRGGHVSVPMEQVVREAEELARGGVKELIVVAQDTTFYGVDLYGERKLAELLRRLAAIDGVEWIRLHYTYPTGFPQEVIDVMRDEPKVCRYIDIPLQHIADTQLSAMRRGITKERTIALLDRLRREVPGIAIRTTLMVGFPGETEADFAELEEFVREQRFDRLGVFPYSAEEGTPSAEMADDVPEEVKQARVERIMKLQQEISLQNNLRRVGETYRVIVDRREGDFYVARTEFDSPEVDEEILIPAAGGTLHPGEFRTVRITDAEEYDLYGELVAEG